MDEAYQILRELQRIKNSTEKHTKFLLTSTECNFRFKNTAIWNFIFFAFLQHL
jgi:hypothetical protein